MSTFRVSTDKIAYDVVCNKRFRVKVKVGVVSRDTMVTVCFKEDSPSCHFLQGKNQLNPVCKLPFSISPDDGYVEKTYYLKIDCDCDPPDQSYAFPMSVVATTAHDETDETTARLDVKCEENHD